VIVGPATQSVTILKPAGGVAPLESTLMLPEVTDPSAWLNGRLWWVDVHERKTTLMFQGLSVPSITYNTSLVDGGQFTSYWDLLGPQWKGRMVATDIRQQGPGGQQAAFLYKHPSIGPAFLERLFTEMGMVLSADQRQMIDWVAQGQYPVGVFLQSDLVAQGAEQGLPLAMVTSDRFKEGGALGPGGGTVNLANEAPHPNAAKVYINWLLSRAGQIAWQEATRQNSLRIDIPKEGLRQLNTPRPGAPYDDGGTEDYQLIGGVHITRIMADLITQAADRR
jgi:ABC-type Fe3+ transport system substrate-binding protein